MPGLRLHHPTAKNTTLIIPHPGGGTINQYPKDYHIRMDNEGNTIVSKTVYDGLQECTAFGFDHKLAYVNEVAKPPTQGVGFQPQKEAPNIERVGTTREGSPSYIENLKRDGIIPPGVTPKVTRHKIVPSDGDN